MGERKFDIARNRKLGVGKWKKMGVLAFQKVAKTGTTEKKKRASVRRQGYRKPIFCRFRPIYSL